MIAVRIFIFLMLMCGTAVGMGVILSVFPGLNTPAFSAAGFSPHWSSLMWLSSVLFSGWVASLPK